MSNTKIEWATKVWNPLRGCSKVSEGCRNCYAIRQAHRFSGEGQPYEGLTRKSGTETNWTGKVKFVPEMLDAPLKWREPQRVFVNSMSDLFHEDVEPIWLAMILDIIKKCPQHIFMILTKRPEKMLEHSNNTMLHNFFKLPNIWFGVSVENQKEAEERIPLLLQTPAAVRFLSCEPLLGPVNLSMRLDRFEMIPGIDWVIVGGESGHKARPMHPDWVRSLRDQCQAAGVPFFFKQWGEHKLVWSCGEYKFLLIGKKSAGRMLDDREWNEYPQKV